MPYSKKNEQFTKYNPSLYITCEEPGFFYKIEKNPQTMNRPPVFSLILK